MALGDKVGIGRTFDDAISSALGLSATNNPPPGGGTTTGGGGGGKQTVDQQIESDLAKAKAAFDEAQSDLQNGDLGGYQSNNQTGLQWLSEAIRLRDEEASPTTTTTRQPPAHHLPPASSGMARSG